MHNQNTYDLVGSNIYLHQVFCSLCYVKKLEFACYWHFLWQCTQHDTWNDKMVRNNANTTVCTTSEINVFQCECRSWKMPEQW